MTARITHDPLGRDRVYSAFYTAPGQELRVCNGPKGCGSLIAWDHTIAHEVWHKHAEPPVITAPDPYRVREVHDLDLSGFKRVLPGDSTPDAELLRQRILDLIANQPTARAFTGHTYVELDALIKAIKALP